jgi:hypothetical protein
MTLNGVPLSLETQVVADGSHAYVLPEYYELTAVAGWNETGVAFKIFRLEENLRRFAAGVEAQCRCRGEFWSNIIGKKQLTYAVYMVSTTHN